MPNVNEVWYHKSQEWTAFVWLDEWNPESVREDEEYVTLIVQKDGKYGTLGFVHGEQNGSIWFEHWMEKVQDSLPTNIKIAAWVHTHSKYGDC